MLTVIVVCFIPILYAAVFLKSIWDPYGKTGNLPVAIVNEDQSIEYRGKTLDVGDQLVEKLKKNDLLDWQFVTKAEANKGLKDKKYYMVITLPKDFSKNASTVMDKTPKKMEITYETNGSLNYLGEVIGEQAVTKLKDQVAESVTSQYATTIIDMIGTVGDGMTQAADGSSKLDDGAGKLADGNKEITTNLDKLASSSITFKDGVNTLDVGLNKYVDGVDKVNDGANKLNDGVSTLAGKVPELAAGVTKLSDGSSTLADGLGKYTDGVGTLNAGAGKLAANSAALNNGTAALKAGASQLNTGAQTLVPGLKELSSGLTLSGEKEAQINGLIDGLPKLNAGLANLNTSIQGIEVGDTTKAKEALDGISALATGISTQAQSAIDKLGSTSATATNDSLAAVQGTTAYANLQPEQQQEITNAINGATTTVAPADNSEVIKTLEGIKAQAGMINQAAQGVKAGLAPLDAMPGQVAMLKAGSAQLAGSGAVALPGATKALTELKAGLGMAKAGVDGKLIPGAQQLTNGISDLSAGSTNLNDGVQTYTAGVGQLSQGAATLSQNSAPLNSGAQQLSGGLGTINHSLPTLTAGIGTLSDGTKTLAGGTTQLAENGPALVSGAGKLADGAGQISDGSGKLAAGSTTLGEGLTTLKDGTSELSGKLGDASKEVTKLALTDKTADMIATPDVVNHEKYSTVPNYGHALAPYFLSVSIFVGCLVFNFVYPIRKIADKDGSALNWFISKATVGGLVATGMAIVAGVVMLMLGLDVAHPFQFFAILLISAYASMFIIMFLAMALDNPGRFIAMMLLVVQLGAAGGTFPVPLTGGFYKALHPFMPMTYSIYGLRQAITSGLGTVTFVQSFGVLLGIAAVALLALALVMTRLKKKHLDGVSQLHGNQSLLNDQYDYQSKYSLW